MDNENILLVVREHWFRLFIKLFVLFILAVTPLVVSSLLGNYLSFLPDSKTQSVIDLMFQLYYLAILVAVFIIIVMYYLNVHIVSEERVVDIDQVGLLNHRISELNIESVQDVSASTVGLFGSIFDYGTVYIQTAGATERFQFENVAKPSHISKVILEVFEQQQAKSKLKS